MTELPRDIHGRSIPAFFNLPGGAAGLTINNDGVNTPVYVDVLLGAQTLPDVPVTIQIWSTVACRIALVEAGNEGFVVEADMAAEWVLPPDTMLALPCLYSSRTRLYACALSTSQNGMLYVGNSADAPSLGPIPSPPAETMVWSGSTMTWDGINMVFTP